MSSLNHYTRKNYANQFKLSLISNLENNQEKSQIELLEK